MGYPEPHRRRNAVCMEKYLAAQCAYEKKQLGFRYPALSDSVSGWELHYSQGHLKNVSKVGGLHKSQ
eukprot:1729691-Ditylum_brightwellii.AAC.1